MEQKHYLKKRFITDQEPTKRISPTPGMTYSCIDDKCHRYILSYNAGTPWDATFKLPITAGECFEFYYHPDATNPENTVIKITSNSFEEGIDITSDIPIDVDAPIRLTVIVRDPSTVGPCKYEVIAQTLENI